MLSRHLLFTVMLGLAAVVPAGAQQKPASTDAAYIARALSAGPPDIAKDAAVVRMDDKGNMTPVRPGKNGFTCLVMDTDRMCSDENSMAFFHAWMTHTAPPDKLGVTYMLAGDHGASNTDPYATKKSATNHWIVTGPHVMIIGPGAKAIGLTEAPDPNPGQPYMMWAGTPYEHAMIPVGPKKASGPAQTSAK